MVDHNELGQPIGYPVPNWEPRPHPPAEEMEGRYCRVEPLQPDRHAADLHEAYRTDPNDADWTYLLEGPFATLSEYRAWMDATCLGSDPMFYAIVDGTNGSASGVAAYLRIVPAHGVIEVGHINLSTRLQRTLAATEAMYLMARRVFDELGYRRYEWKCDALNLRSRAAAIRLGFRFEGVFRNALVYRGRNRDSAWYSMIDSEWPALEAAFRRWLDPANFDEDGRQRASLSRLTQQARAELDPSPTPV